jgi:hypothetical protein
MRPDNYKFGGKPSNTNKNCNIKKKLEKAQNNYAANPGDSKEVHKFYDRIIRLSTNSSNSLFPRKEPKENWSKYKTEEEYDNSLKNAVEFSNKFTEEQKKSIDVIIFNKTNADGVMSGYISWNYITEGGSTKTEIKVFGTSPNFQKFGIAKEILAIESYLVGKNVIIVDLAFNKDTLEHINKKANFIVFIDNHKSEEVAKLPYVYITDTGSRELSNHAACAAVWKFFHPDESVPYIIQSVDSADAKLYLKYLPDPSPISTALAVKFLKNQSKPEYNTNPIKLFEDLHEFLTEGTSLQALNFLAVLGQVMDRFAENMKLEVASKAYPATFKTAEKNYKVYVLNYAQPGLQKRVAKYIASQHMDADFSVLWFYNHREQSFDVTLSSSHRPGESADLVKIAKSIGYSGGGFKDTAHFMFKGSPGDLKKIIRT